MDSDRAERLREDIHGEVLALQDIVDSLNEVYNGGPRAEDEATGWNVRDASRPQGGRKRLYWSEETSV